MLPFNYAQAITKSDTDPIAKVGANVAMGAIYVGGAGNIVVVFESGATATFMGALAGTIIPLTQVLRVNSTNTTATNLLALYRT